MITDISGNTIIDLKDLDFTPPIPEFAEVVMPDYERIIARMTRPPLIANDIDTSTVEGEEQLQAILYTRFQGDTISAVPMCSCGKLQGGVNHGLTCPSCLTQCKNQLERPIETTLWIRALDGVEKFITPGFWSVLSPFLTSRGWNMLEWMVSKDVPDPEPDNRFYNIANALELKPEDRNLNFFYHHYDQLLYKILVQLILRKKPRDVKGLNNVDILNLYNGLRSGDIDAFYILLNTPLGNKLKDEKEFAAFVKKYSKLKSCVFSQYLPMPSSAGIVLESNSSGTWFDKVMLIAVDAMFSITSIEKTIQEKTFKYKNAKMVYCIKKMAEYSSEYIRKRIMGKKGLYRSHFFGGRQPFTMRCVIGPVIGPAPMDEVHLPWAPSVQMLRPMITNKLLRMGSHPDYGPWTPKSIGRFIDGFTNRYNALLDQIMMELIQETPNSRGLQALYNRPPSLEKGSIEKMFVPKIKKEPHIKTISMSTNATVTFNELRSLLLKDTSSKPLEIAGNC